MLRLNLKEMFKKLRQVVLKRGRTDWSNRDSEKEPVLNARSALPVRCHPQRRRQTRAARISVELTWLFNSHSPPSASLRWPGLQRGGHWAAPLLRESRTCPHTAPCASLSGPGASRSPRSRWSHWQRSFQSRGFWKTRETPQKMTCRGKGRWALPLISQLIQ